MFQALEKLKRDDIEGSVRGVVRNGWKRSPCAWRMEASWGTGVGAGSEARKGASVVRVCDKAFRRGPDTKVVDL